jgi:hypothetical protein
LHTCLEYASGSERHGLRLYARPTQSALTADTGDYLYLTPIGAESGILATLAAFGPLWAAYYDPEWQLVLRALWWLSGTSWTLAPALPRWAGQAGTLPEPQATAPPIGALSRTRGYESSARGRKPRMRMVRP